MKSTKAAMLLTIAVALAVCFVPMGQTDADTHVGSVSSDFDSMHGGTIYIDFTGTTNTFDATIVVTEGSKVLYDEVKTIEKGDCTISIYLPNMKSTGDHAVTITFTPVPGSDGEFDHGMKTVNIHVKNNVLSNWSTYLIIIVAAIVIAALVYLRMRDKPKVENTMTFEQLEEERKAEMAAKAEKKKGKGYTPPASSTERKKYKGGKSQ